MRLPRRLAPHYEEKLRPVARKFALYVLRTKHAAVAQTVSRRV